MTRAKFRFRDYHLRPDTEPDAEPHTYLQQEKQRNGWTPRITIADWMKIGAGHAILIEPDGRAIASPVWQAPDCLEVFGNLYESSAQNLWQNFPYKENHINKYLERTMMVL